MSNFLHSNFPKSRCIWGMSRAANLLSKDLQKISITVVVYFSYPPYFDSELLAGYPKEIVLLEQLCWRVQSTGGVTKVHNYSNKRISSL